MGTLNTPPLSLSLPLRQPEQHYTISPSWRRPFSLSPLCSSLSSLGQGLEVWILEVFVLRLCGKGGPILLVPSGVLNSSQSRMICALFWTNFDFPWSILEHEIVMVL